MCNKINRAGQYTLDLINNISRDVQEECANRLYMVYIYIYIYIYIAAIRMMDNSEYITDY